MEKHERQIVIVCEENTFKGKDGAYDTVYYYCDRTDEFTADEAMISRNDTAIKNDYQLKNGLLAADESITIRNQHSMNQNAMCRLGRKPSPATKRTRYRNIAHDIILRKLRNDPYWFLSLL